MNEGKSKTTVKKCSNCDKIHANVKVLRIYENAAKDCLKESISDFTSFEKKSQIIFGSAFVGLLANIKLLSSTEEISAILYISSLFTLVGLIILCKNFKGEEIHGYCWKSDGFYEKTESCCLDAKIQSHKKAFEYNLLKVKKRTKSYQKGFYLVILGIFLPIAIQLIIGVLPILSNLLLLAGDFLQRISSFQV